MLDLIQSWVFQAGAWGALGFFVGAFLEEVAFPLPSPLLLIGVAFFTGNPLSLLAVLKMLGLVILPVSLGATLGSLVIYGLAYFGGKATIDRFAKWLSFSWTDVIKLQEKLDQTRSDEWLLFLSRCLPFTPTTLLTAMAGIIRMNIPVFILVTFAGIFIRVTALFVGALILGQSIFGQ